MKALLDRLSMDLLMIAVPVILCIAISGCTTAMRENLKDGYQFGDLTDAQMKNLDAYCGDDLGMARTVARTSLWISFGTRIPLDVCLTYEAVKANANN